MAERFVCKGSTADEAWSPQADQAEDTLPTIDDPFASNIFSASSAQDSIISTSGFITVLRSLLAPRVEKGTSPNGTLSLMGPSDTSQDGQPFWTGSHSAACLEPIDVAPSSPMAGNPSQDGVLPSTILHAEETNHARTCPTCGKVFSRPDVVQRHFVAKHYIQPGPRKTYVCVRCPRYQGTDRKDHFNQHKRKVHDYAPFQCAFAGCEKIGRNGWYREYDRRAHQKEAHPLVDETELAALNRILDAKIAESFSYIK